MHMHIQTNNTSHVDHYAVLLSFINYPNFAVTPHTSEFGRTLGFFFFLILHSRTVAHCTAFLTFG